MNNCIACGKGKGVLCPECLKAGKFAPIVKCLNCNAYVFLPSETLFEVGSVTFSEGNTKRHGVAGMMFITDCPQCWKKPTCIQAKMVDEFTIKGRF